MRIQITWGDKYLGGNFLQIRFTNRHFIGLVIDYFIMVIIARCWLTGRNKMSCGAVRSQSSPQHAVLFHHLALQCLSIRWAWIEDVAGHESLWTIHRQMWLTDFLQWRMFSRAIAIGIVLGSNFKLKCELPLVFALWIQCIKWKITYSLHLMYMKIATTPSRINPTHKLIIINSNVSSNPLPGNSISSTPDNSRAPGDVSHMNAAKHGCESLPVRLAMALRGSKNDGNGGGGIDNIVSGGGPTS